MKCNKFFALILVLASCSWGPKAGSHVNRKFSSVAIAQGKIDLYNEVDSLNNALNGLDKNNCQNRLQNLIGDFSSISYNKLDQKQLELDGENLLKEFFLARMNFHDSLTNLNSECQALTKELYLSMRRMEDYIGVMHFKDDQISSSVIDYFNSPAPILEQDKYHPYFLNPKMMKDGAFEFQNGDIMITMGVSFVSATITEISTPKAVHSHIVFVHVKKDTKEVETIESYVGKGVAIFPIKYALQNENARILVLRPKNQKLASDASDYIYNKVVALKKEKKYIPYDYDLDFSDDSRLSCEEVAYTAFNKMSDGKFIIPEQMSQITMSDEDFLKKVGINKGPMMVPRDMETDTRFDIVLDWTDYRVMRDSHRKGAVLAAMLKWMDEDGFKIKKTLKNKAAKVIWGTRYIPGLWQLLSKASGIPTDFTKDVPGDTIATMGALKDIGGILLKQVTDADQKYFAANGRYLTRQEMLKVLIVYKDTNPKELFKIFGPK